MAALRKRGKKWVAEVRIKGSYRSKTFNTKIEAQAWALNAEQQLGKHPGLLASHSLREAMRRYAEEISPTKKGWRWEDIRLKNWGVTL